MNTIKRSTIAKHFVNNQSFSKNFSLERFKTIKDCYNVFDLVKIEAICIFNRKPTTLRRKKLNSVALFP